MSVGAAGHSNWRGKREPELDIQHEGRPLERWEARMFETILQSPVR